MTQYKEPYYLFHYNNVEIGIPVYYTEKLIEYIINDKTEEALDDIQNGFAAEGSLTLPMYEWYNKTNNPLKEYHKYRRDIRFIISGSYIVGIRVKDGLLWWTEEEIKAIETIVLKYIEEKHL